MDTSLTCHVCRRAYPSIYWFRVGRICIDCYTALSDEQRHALAIPAAPAPASDRIRPFPTLGEGVLMLVGAAIIFILSSLLCLLAGYKTPIAYACMYMVTVGSMTTLALIGKRTHREPGTPLVNMRYCRPAICALGAVVVALIALIGGAYIGLLIGVFHWSPASLLRLGAMRTGPAWIIIALAVAPILEELLFRGVILDGFLKQMTPAKAICWSALLFALGHPIPALVNIFAAGVLLGWIYTKTGSLSTVIFLHAFNNLFVGGIGLVMPKGSIGFEFLPVSANVGILVAASTLAGGVIVLMSKRMPSFSSV